MAAASAPARPQHPTAPPANVCERSSPTSLPPIRPRCLGATPRRCSSSMRDVSDGVVVDHPGQSQRVLGVFAKRPVPGQVKTRLAAVTSAEWATRVAAALLADSLDRLAGIDARRLLVFAP